MQFKYIKFYIFTCNLNTVRTDIFLQIVLNRDIFFQKIKGYCEGQQTEIVCYCLYWSRHRYQPTGALVLVTSSKCTAQKKKRWGEKKTPFSALRPNSLNAQNTLWHKENMALKTHWLNSWTKVFTNSTLVSFLKISSSWFFFYNCSVKSLTDFKRL